MMRRSALVLWLLGLEFLGSAAVALAAVEQFQGVAPGATSETELLANKKWGSPQSRTALNEGASLLQFALRGYRDVIVLVRNGRVQSIDVVLPGGVSPETVAAALKLGEPLQQEALPVAALLGSATDPTWKPVRYSAGRVAVFVGNEGHATLVRYFADEVIENTAPDTAPAVAASPDAITKPSLQGQDALSRQIVAAVARMLPAQHLSRHPLDDEIGERVAALLLQQLDAQKIYLLRDDVVRFQERHDLIDDQLRRGDLTFAYELFATHLERVSQHVELALALLDEEHDFNVDETFQADAAQADYPANELEVREIWRKRIKYELLAQLAEGHSLADARRSVRQRYLRYQRLMQNFSDDALRDTTINTLCQAYDPHSNYISPAQIENFRIQGSGELVGIGASLQSIDGFVTVASVIAGGPASRDGRLKTGDRILAVGRDEEASLDDVVNVELAYAVDRIRGPVGSVVKLRVLPKGEFESTVYELRRAKVDLYPIGKTVIDAKNLPPGRSGRIGFIRLPSFYYDSGKQAQGRSATGDVRKVLEEFQKQQVEMVVLDLRQNGGGSLLESVNMVGLFIAGEPIAVQVRGADGRVQGYNAAGVTQAWSGPLVVLTDTVSAGGTEIFAGAIQDFRRGLVIGEQQSHGMGTSASNLDIGQTLFPDGEAPKLGILQVSQSKFYRPSGEGTQIRGIVPDITIASANSANDHREDRYAHALKFDSITSANFKPLMFYAIDDDLRAALDNRSKLRRSGSEYFQKLDGWLAETRALSQAPISLQREKFAARQRKLAAFPSTSQSQALPDIPEVKLDDNLQEVLATALDYAARVHVADAARSATAKQYSAAIQSYQKAVAADPHLAIARYQLSWMLATNPDARLRNGKLAVEHAQRACELDDWQSWYYILALAVAQAEAGDFDGAQKHLKQALDKAPADQRTTYEYLKERFRKKQALR